MNINEQLKIQAIYSRIAKEGSGYKAPSPAPSLDLTPEGIDAMDKEALVELLEAHGVDVDKRKGAATLAGELKAVVFSDGL